MILLVEMVIILIMLHFFIERGAFLSLRQQDYITYFVFIISLVVNPGFTFVILTYEFAMEDLAENIKEALNYEEEF